MNDPKINRDVKRRVEKGRLVYYYEIADQGFWEDLWAKELTPDYYKPFLAGRLNGFEKIIKRHFHQLKKIFIQLQILRD